MASRLPCLFYVLMLAILTSVLTTVNSTLLTYDRQTLLDIGNLISFSPDAVWSVHRRSPRTFPIFSVDGTFDVLRRRRRRRRGKRAGVTIRIKSDLLSGFTRPSDFPSLASWPVSGRYVARHSLERPYRWIRLIAPSFLDAPISPQICGGGIKHGVLHLLNQGHPLPSESPPIRMGLINVCSLVSKTFILHNFFT